MLLGYARVSKADGSQLLDPQPTPCARRASTASASTKTG